MSRVIVHILVMGVVAMSMSRVVITGVVVEGRSKSEVARGYGVPRRWVQTLVARYLAEGEAAFEPRSRRPRTQPRRVPVDVEDAIVACRKQLAEAGWDAGAHSIASRLSAQGVPTRRWPRSGGSCPTAAS